MVCPKHLCDITTVFWSVLIA